ncbi:MAG: V-type ATP synthase subunit E family protein [Oscillospiraceae bacterium]
MNGIEKITARIAADAEDEARVIREESARRCAELREENERQAQAEYQKLLKSGGEETEQRSSRIDRTARLEAKKGVLSMKQEEVSRAFAMAKDKISALPEQDYIGFLARQAASASITGEEELILSPEDRSSIGAKVVKAANEQLSRGEKPARLTLSERTRSMAGGLVLKQGDIEVNCTVDTLLELSRGELAAQVAEVLFEG